MTLQVGQNQVVQNQVVDALDLWEAESQSNQPALSLIRLDGNERLLVPFTPMLARVDVHYLDTASVSGYCHCNGHDCVLCRTGHEKVVRDLWPVFDLVEQTVGVVPITPNMRAFTLRPQLFPILRQAKEGKERLLVTIRFDKPRYHVSCTPLPADTADGAAQIQQFMNRLAAKDIDLGSVYQRFANPELAEIPEVAIRLKAKGITV
jgi:hypothetical protein